MTELPMRYLKLLNQKKQMSKFSNYYFVGIGGIGMSAIARYFKFRGFRVAGYDKTETPLTRQLISEGIEITYSEAESAIFLPFRDNESTLVIFTPAIPKELPQLEYFRKNNFKIVKRAEILGEITKMSHALCIAGTHGKTTTSTITAHLLYQSKVGCSAFLGGISNNYDSNLLVSNKNNLVVVEADEYDRSFHHLEPYMAVITSTDPDHLDIYGTEAEYYKSFEKFTSLIKENGVLICNEKVKIAPKLKPGVQFYTYGLSAKNNFYAENIRTEKGALVFDFITPSEPIKNIRLNVPILVNVENSVAAMTLAWLNGVSKEEIRTGVASYSGIYRRFNVVFKSDKTIYLDDYAHHPGELEKSISSIKYLYPNRKITAIFQPHLYSRTRDFADEFAKALSQVDELILLDIYPAREKPIEGITSNIIFKNITCKEKILIEKKELLNTLKNKDLDILITLGAGDIDKLVPEIKTYLETL